MRQLPICLVVVVLVGCGKPALTPEDLAKHHPGGTPLTQDEQQQLQASLSPRDYLAFKRKFELLARSSGHASQQSRASAANEEHLRELQQLISTPRTLSAPERQVVGTWVTADMFLTEAPSGTIRATLQLKSNGLGSLTLLNLQTNEKTEERAAWQVADDHMKLEAERDTGTVSEHDWMFTKTGVSLNVSWSGGSATLTKT